VRGCVFECKEVALGLAERSAGWLRIWIRIFYYPDCLADPRAATVWANYLGPSAEPFATCPNTCSSAADV